MAQPKRRTRGKNKATQLELMLTAMLDFNSQLKAAQTTFEQNLRGVARSGPMQDSLPQTLTRQVPQARIEAARRQLNDVARRIAKLKKIKFNEAWRLIWGRLYEATGFDALGVQLSRGLGCPLDAIQECRRLKDALKAAETLVDGSA